MVIQRSGLWIGRFHEVPRKLLPSVSKLVFFVVVGGFLGLFSFVFVLFFLNFFFILTHVKRTNWKWKNKCMLKEKKWRHGSSFPLKSCSSFIEYMRRWQHEDWFLNFFNKWKALKQRGGNARLMESCHRSQRGEQTAGSKIWERKCLELPMHAREKRRREKKPQKTSKNLEETSISTSSVVELFPLWANYFQAQ